MATMKVTDSSFEQDVLKSSEPVVVDFWAEWCGPCRMIGPALEEISNEMAGKVKIAKVNVDENPQIASQFGIRSIPALMLFKDGKLAAQKVGAAPKGDLARWIQGATISILAAAAKPSRSARRLTRGPGAEKLAIIHGRSASKGRCRSCSMATPTK